VTGVDFTFSESLIHWINFLLQWSTSTRKRISAPPTATMKRRSTLADALDRIQANAAPPSRYVPGPVDVSLIRRRIGMTQTQFARRFGFPVATIRHWERGERKPQGSALVLLNLIARNSQAVLQALSSSPQIYPWESE
jgi:putative transcriptional regulator